MTLFTASHACCPARVSRLSALKKLLSVWHQRRALGRLDTRALDDIGLTRSDVQRELRRPIWDAPENWRC